MTILLKVHLDKQQKLICSGQCLAILSKSKLNSVAWVHERTIPTERLPTFADRGYHVVVSVMGPYGNVHGFLDRSRYFFFQVAPQLYSQG
jgi:hypothetical protein